MPDANPFEEFKEKLDIFPEMWNSIDTRAVVTQSDEGLILLALDAVLSLETKTLSEILLDIEGIRIIHEIRKIDYLNELLEGLERSQTERAQIRMYDEDITLIGFQHFDYGSDKGHHRGYFKLELPTVWLRSFGSKVNDLIDEDSLDKRLITWSYEDLHGLTKAYLGFSIGSGTSTQIYVKTPIYITIDGEFVDDNLQVEAKYHPTINPRDILVSPSISAQEPFDPIRITFDEDDIIKKTDEFITCQKTISIPESTTDVRTRIFFKGKEMDLAWIHKPPERSKINPLSKIRDFVYGAGKRRELEETVLDVGRREFESFIDHRQYGSNGTRFELVTTNLFSSAGFYIIFCGSGVGTPGIDAIAFSPVANEVFLISCVTANDIHKKLRTLLPQLNSFKEIFDDFEVNPVIFSLARDDDIIPSDKDDAEKLRVSLILEPDLKELNELLYTQPLDDFHKLVLERIKSNERYIAVIR